ncbi:MAG: membrane protein insertion efficiency factor YidD [Anaerolineales bacterium]|nr:membrane protein insertion efficiency factor YidD [Anaerolineales bacterium]
MSKIILSHIRIYQRFLSPLLPRTCRFQPSCSHYAYTAIEQHGTRRGSMLTVKRVLRCHPFNSGGYDPVPESHSQSLADTGQELAS